MGSSVRSDLESSHWIHVRTFETPNLSGVSAPLQVQFIGHGLTYSRNGINNSAENSRSQRKCMEPQSTPGGVLVAYR